MSDSTPQEGKDAGDAAAPATSAWMRAEPWLFRGVVVALLAAGAWFAAPVAVKHGLLGGASPVLGSERVVVFDAVKFANAQRKVAAAFLRNDMPAVSNPLAVQEETQQVIRAIAGRGTIVLLKQAVLLTDVPDITDDVLRAMKLPTDVPSFDPAKVILDPAPTQLFTAPGAPRSAPGGLPSGPGAQVLP